MATSAEALICSTGSGGTVADSDNGGCPERLVPYQWQPGQSGNPAGRPKKPSFEDLVEHVLEEAKIEGVDCKPREALAARFVALLFAGNEKLLIAYLDRAWPKLQKHEVRFPETDNESVDAAIDRFMRDDEASVPSESDESGTP